MEGVFVGFATIGLLIALGLVLAHVGVIDAAGQQTLSTLAFYVASPALLLVTLQSSDLAEVFSGNVVALAGAVMVSGGIQVVVSLVRRRDFAHTVVATQCSAYGNAGNLGFPISAYVLGDVALVAPLVLLQLLVLQPLVLTLLDVAVSPTRLSIGRVLSRPLKNPITIGSLVGLLLAVADVRLPVAVEDPIRLLAGMAVPGMLLAYGVSLRLGPLPGRGVPVGELGVVVVLKMVVQPVAAYLLGRFVLGLDAEALLAVTVFSALPTAQNVYIIASRYDRAALLARDAIFVSTILSAPIVLLVTVLVAP